MKNRTNKICVIFTGGTIGSANHDGRVDLDGGSADALIAAYRERTSDNIVFDCLRPLDMLSENMTAPNLETLADCVCGVNCADYDGIIITHGTDTLNFTANYFSLIFADARIPIVFVSALFPLSDPRSNGYDNFAGAAAFIQSTDFGGVFIAFKNPNEACKIHLASRLVSSSQLVGAYDSLLGAHFGTVGGDGFTRDPSPANPSDAEMKEPRLPMKRGLCGDVITIESRALLDYDLYDFTRRSPRAVIVRPYHSGTVCMAGEQSSFARFCKRCAALGIPVVLAPIGSRANVYASAKDLAALCIPAYDVSTEMATVKVMNALARGADIKECLEQNVFFEKVASRES